MLRRGPRPKSDWDLLRELVNNNHSENAVINFGDEDSESCLVNDGDNDSRLSASLVDDGLDDSSASEAQSIAASVADLNSVSGRDIIRTKFQDLNDNNFDDDAESVLSSASEISVQSALIDRISLEENQRVPNPHVLDENDSGARFFSPEDFIDVSKCVNSDAPSNLRVEEELLLHIIKEEQLPPRVFDRIMKWGRLCRENNYDFEAPGFCTAMKRWKEHYLNSALKEPSLQYVQEEWQSVPSHVPVIDPLPQITAILNDSELMMGALWSSDVQTSVDGSPLYGDINTGTQWCTAERKMNLRIKDGDPHSACHHHCGVLLFDDNTMGDGLGRLQKQPVLGTICILPKQSK